MNISCSFKSRIFVNKAPNPFAAAYASPRPVSSQPSHSTNASRLLHGRFVCFKKARAAVCRSRRLRVYTCAALAGVAETSSTKVGKQEPIFPFRRSILTVSYPSRAVAKTGGYGREIIGLAKNLIKAGYQVTVWNRSPDKCKPLEEMGAKIAKDPQSLAEQSDVVLAMLADPKAAEEVGKGIAAGISEGKGYVDISTIDGDTAKRIKQAVEAKGGQYLEAPVSGSKQPAEQGTLIFLCGGDKSLYDFASPLLDVMGKAKFFLGEVGNGANMKLVVNMVMGTMMASFAEGLALADKAGLSQEDFIEVSGLGAIAAPMFGMKGPSMKDQKYPTAFPLKHQRKDLELALRYAQSRDQSLPVAAATTDLFKKAEGEGHGDADFSAVLEAIRS